jgi:predicted esterase
MKNRSTYRFAAIGGAIAALFVLVALLAESNSAADDKALAMPVKELTARAGSYNEVRTDRFTVRQPEIYKFEPSEKTRMLSTRHITFDGAWPRLWYSYAPQTPAKMPIVILLHGAGRDGLSLIEVWNETAIRYGIALVAPNSKGRTWSLNDPSPQFITDIIDEMSAKYQIDASRIFLFGHSDGAAYAQILLNRTQGPWRAAALHAGYAPLSWLRPAQFSKPIRFYFGENEDIFDLDDARSISKWFAKNGSPSEIVIIPTHNHWLYKVGPQIADDAWQWFSSLDN